ncbi:hypothetical protein LTR56_000135 [Elasticomyces elasticus]|nr:hypothetical protein LTR56_000135 [Elasticomyces elasticus]KAK3667123.1 hypothetical protein LTR22_001987 [Elasticomyces elasticus]KAK4932898.1 hypothetical protein LTR49_000854 [Elasticomyces elasticus]KAK5768698.1 hypothetical protein LTS12_001124 [Elasticomyces elasticus]
MSLEAFLALLGVLVAIILGLVSLVVMIWLSGRLPDVCTRLRALSAHLQAPLIRLYQQILACISSCRLRVHAARYLLFVVYNIALEMVRDSVDYAGAQIRRQATAQDPEAHEMVPVGISALVVQAAMRAVQDQLLSATDWVAAHDAHGSPARQRVIHEVGMNGHGGAPHDEAAQPSSVATQASSSGTGYDPAGMQSDEHVSTA